MARRASPQILVVDPVMVATSGDSLLEPDAEHAMITFCSRATVVTPNIEELARLTGGERAHDEQAALEQAREWSARTGVAVVVKTGHLDSATVTNTWVDPDGTCLPVPSTRLSSTSTHGTGCSLAAALATRLGGGVAPQAALAWSTQWLHEAISHGEALRVGSGHGPVDHSHRARRLQAAGESTPGSIQERSHPSSTPRTRSLRRSAPRSRQRRGSSPRSPRPGHGRRRCGGPASRWPGRSRNPTS
ncbi:PfkB family carbohydrate kinase [Brachybacterium sp. Z12]|uniref:PfkB family carbohydrate kinase n=1 Tax=Brachybacterium sp. Z12 TaxID=2759167 RepID=UPI0037C13AC6